MFLLTARYLLSFRNKLLKKRKENYSDVTISRTVCRADIWSTWFSGNILFLTNSSENPCEDFLQMEKLGQGFFKQPCIGWGKMVKETCKRGFITHLKSFITCYCLLLLSETFHEYF